MLKGFLLKLSRKKLYTATIKQCCPYEFDIYPSICLAENKQNKQHFCNKCWGTIPITEKNIYINIRQIREENLLDMYCVSFFDSTIKKNLCDNDCNRCWKDFIRRTKIKRGK